MNTSLLTEYTLCILYCMSNTRISNVHGVCHKLVSGAGFSLKASHRECVLTSFRSQKFVFSFVWHLYFSIKAKLRAKHLFLVQWGCALIAACFILGESLGGMHLPNLPDQHPPRSKKTFPEIGKLGRQEQSTAGLWGSVVF